MLFDLILSKIVGYAVAGHYHVQSDSETIFKLYEKDREEHEERITNTDDSLASH